MHAAKYQRQLEIRVIFQQSARAAEYTPVLSARTENGDPPRHEYRSYPFGSGQPTLSKLSNSPAWISVLAVRPLIRSRIDGGNPVPGRLMAIMATSIDAPLGISRAATRLLRATTAVLASLKAGAFTPFPSAPSTLRIPRTKASN